MRVCCTDHNGKPKRKYSSQDEAERVAVYRKEEGISLRVYPCDEGDGWHLTSAVSTGSKIKVYKKTRERESYSEFSQYRIAGAIGKNIFSEIPRSGSNENHSSDEQANEELQLEVDKEKIKSKDSFDKIPSMLEIATNQIVSERWEYRRVVLRGGPNIYDSKYVADNCKEIEQKFNELGAEGWELITVTQVYGNETAYKRQSIREYFFKRHIIE